jgi:hypothetical protein
LVVTVENSAENANTGEVQHGLQLKVWPGAGSLRFRDFGLGDSPPKGSVGSVGNELSSDRMSMEGNCGAAQRSVMNRSKRDNFRINKTA